MTALAAITGMLPLTLGLGAGSQMLQPLAIADYFLTRGH